MKKRTGIALLLVLIVFMMPVREVFAEVSTELPGGEEPPVVRVGNFAYSRETVQESLDSMITAAAAMKNRPLTAEERGKLADSAVENMISVGLIECKLTEAGIHDFTSEEQERMKAAAQSQYEQLWSQAGDALRENDPAVTDEQVTAEMESRGYTVDALYRETEITERQYRAIDLFCGNLLLTEEEIANYYEEQFLAPERERYRDNIPLFEKEVLERDGEAFYTPEGYRLVLQILLPYPAEAEKAWKPWAQAVRSAAAESAQAYTDLAVAAATAQDWSELDAPRAEYDRTIEALGRAQKAWEARRENIALPLAADTLAEISRRFQAGETFPELIAAFSRDRSERNSEGRGYPVHQASEGWPKAFIEAVFAMEKPGEISAPVLTEQGIHLLFYAGDLPGGDHVLTEEEAAQLEQSAKRYYQTEALYQLMQEWKKDIEIETHPELLVY